MSSVLLVCSETGTDIRVSVEKLILQLDTATPFFIVIYKSISGQQIGKLTQKKCFFTINSLSSSGPDPNCD